MSQNEGGVSSSASGKISGAKRLAAFAVVFIMIAGAFMTITSGAPTNPVIYTSQDEYGPGEVVYIYGEGWASFETVTIDIYHPDLGTKSFPVRPDVYGKFVFDQYVAEWVGDTSTPVNVTATQVFLGQEYVAYTEFYDPAAYIEGYTLKPVMRFTTGDIKGYNEGDAVPMMVVLNRNQLGGGEEVTVFIGVDYRDVNSPTRPVYGIDYLTQPWGTWPKSPYNNHPSSPAPFVPKSGDGTISSQGYVETILDEGVHQEIQVWRFTFHFGTGVTTAQVWFGAHLALTENLGIPSIEKLGASFYPGSALHVRLVELIPSADEGNRDVPIALATLMMPPMMTLEKCCDPTEVVYGDTITFTIEYSNIGQATAECVYLWDVLPEVIDLDVDSFLWKTSEMSSWMDVSGLIDLTSDGFEFDIGSHRGTGVDSAMDPLVAWLKFTGVVNTGEEGTYYNDVYLSFSDDHGG
ncbi:TPA: hypothetical protein HA259_08315, partial [Thermoplasmata archaeon]|nr:hypothetical protein [Thermoplasmata archaeon]